MRITTRLVEAEVVEDGNFEVDKIELLDTLIELQDVDGINVFYAIPDPKITDYLLSKKIIAKAPRGVRLADETLRRDLLDQIESIERIT